MSHSSDSYSTMRADDLERLQALAEYSQKDLTDVILEFRENENSSTFNNVQQVDFAGFQNFMKLFTGGPLPEDSCVRIFRSFQKNKSSITNGNSLTSDEFDNELVPLQDIACHLSLLKGGQPEDKLKFVFNLHDTDGNGSLDNSEMERIINQMMGVAQHLGWDVSELRPILQEMLKKIDYDEDGVVTLQEWIKGGMNNTPLLVLLGLENGVRDDGSHAWRIKHFSLPAYCNFCSNMLVGLGRQGLSCSFCKYTAHERCVDQVSKQCVHTYTKTSRQSQNETDHVWIKGNNVGPCHRCKKPIKSHQGLIGQHCRWCQLAFHEKCIDYYSSKQCDLGSMRPHILPPWTICPKILNDQKIKSRNNSTNDVIDANLTEHVESVTKVNTTGCDEQGLQITPLSDTQPLLVFINPKSGGKLGGKLIFKMQSLLNPRQVFDLTKGGPAPGLKFFKDVKDFRVLCCGGDGTVGWILDAIDKIEMSQHPPVAILPLGTGNDLARCTKWGGGYDGGSIIKFLHQVHRSSLVMMDRWSLCVSPDPQATEQGDPVPLSIINNYFSIGVDASICRKFHVMREKHPQKFNSRMKNKLWYSAFGTSETFAASCKKLYDHLDVTVDGVKLESWSRSRYQGIAILNISSVYGGANLWGPTKKPKPNLKEEDPKKIDLKYAKQDMGDRKLEIVGVEGAMEVGQIITGLRAGQRLAQGSDIQITTKKLFPMQVDGEPWLQAPCKISISHKNQVPMLVAPAAESSSFVSLFRRRISRDQMN